MNESSITIRWEKNPDGSTDISVNGDIDGQTHFSEAFLSLDTLPSVHSVDERETSGESAGNSATVSLLRSLIEIIRKSNKINGYIIAEQERNSKFPFTDLITIRKFAQIAGIKIDERKFRNRREFQMYFRELMKEYKKEGGLEMITLCPSFEVIPFGEPQIPPQLNSPTYSLSALERANSLGIKFLGETFETQNTLESRNGQSQFVSNSYSQGPPPSQIANQAEKHYFAENAVIERSNYHNILSKRV